MSLNVPQRPLIRRSRYSKRMAEKAAWKFADEHPDLHIAVLNPSGTLGPLVLDRADGECVKLMKRIMEGGDNGTHPHSDC